MRSAAPPETTIDSRQIMTENSHPSVWARGLVRRFGKKTAVDGVDLSIGRGEFYGLLGPNGAGKTTTIKMIVGLLRPTEGTAGINSLDTWQQPLEVKRKIGVLPEEFNLYERLTGAELLDFTSAIHRLPREDAIQRRRELLRLLDLEDAASDLIADYSRGMRKKLALAAAVIHAPPVLFLDEPFEGVDAVSARLIRRLLQQYTERGATIVFSSHVMDLVERLCTRIGIMLHGKLVIEATPEELRHQFGVGSVEDAFLEVVGAGDMDEGLEWLGASSG
jgi:ABC-2 type transport system ATP-binding protein